MAYTAFSGDATQGTGSHLDVFIPELWADGIYRYFEKNLVMKPFFDDYSSLVQGAGDTLHIPTVQEVAVASKSANTGVAYSVNTETDIDLSIDQHKYAAKLFEDIAMVQSNEQLNHLAFSQVTMIITIEVLSGKPKSQDKAIRTEVHTKCGQGQSIAGEKI